MEKVPASELNRRLDLFISNMSKFNKEWKLSVIFDSVNLFYLTGTMQNGALFVFRDGNAFFFVKRNFDRAKKESNFEKIINIKSFKEIRGFLNDLPSEVYIPKEVTPIGLLERFNRYFRFDYIESCDLAINYSRALKSEYELSFIRKAGEIHRIVKEEIVPRIMRENISEFDLAREVLSESMKLGNHGFIRVKSFNGELFLGNICFGESSNYPISFDGPGGIRGICPSIPLFGNQDIKLKRDMLVYVDTVCSYMGYHTDKTQIYSTGKLPKYVYEEHKRCVEIQNRIAEMLKPGITPSEIYNRIFSSLDSKFLDNFMGYGSNRVKFLGHGIGMHVDEYPAIAKGFDLPLMENMVIAVEPKKGLDGIGTVGIENTFLVTEKGGVSLTGSNFEIINVELS